MRGCGCHGDIYKEKILEIGFSLIVIGPKTVYNRFIGWQKVMGHIDLRLTAMSIPNCRKVSKWI